MSSQKKSVGFIIALIGGSIGLLAFFAMPFLSAFGILSISAQQFASLASQYGSTLGSTFNSQIFELLWLAPVLCVVIVVVSALQFRGSAQVSSTRSAAGWLMALGILGIALYAGILIYTGTLVASTSSGISSSNPDAPSVLSYLGSGFWAYIIGMAGVAIGGLLGLSTNAAPMPVYPPTTMQYPPYQQPWPHPQQNTQYPPNPQNQSYPQNSQYPPYPSAPDASHWPSTPPTNPYE